MAWVWQRGCSSRPGTFLMCRRNRNNEHSRQETLESSALAGFVFARDAVVSDRTTERATHCCTATSAEHGTPAAPDHVAASSAQHGDTTADAEDGSASAPEQDTAAKHGDATAGAEDGSAITAKQDGTASAAHRQQLAEEK